MTSASLRKTTSVGKPELRAGVIRYNARNLGNEGGDLAARWNVRRHAITGLTKSTALDGREFDIACGQIDIGNAASDMTKRMATGVLQANGTTAVEETIDPKHIADAVVYMAGLPLSANVLTMTVMATRMPFVGRG